MDRTRDVAARIRAMENRTGSVGDCTKLANYRSNKPGFFRRRSTRRRISNAQRLADLGDFINTRLECRSIVGYIHFICITPSQEGALASNKLIFNSQDVT
ncbi:unnamed protein product [Caenorhabditis nigoni]